MPSAFAFPPHLNMQMKFSVMIFHFVQKKIISVHFDGETTKWYGFIEIDRHSFIQLSLKYASGLFSCFVKVLAYRR